jgi:hypothetical protein
MVKHFGVAAQAWRASFRDKVSALLERLLSGEDWELRCIFFHIFETQIC